jgi:Fe-S-cluster containining protein
MEDFAFECVQCGSCCREDREYGDQYGYKRIPLYPEEAVRLERLAEDNEIELHLIEDIVFPDTKNSRIQVLTYRILLDNDEKRCPFLKNGKDCIINERKPRACLAYPLSVKNEDAFTMRIEIDPLCEYTVRNLAKLQQLDDALLQTVYPAEYGHAMEMLKRNKRAVFKLLALEKEGKIVIPKNIERSDYTRYLQTWERQELKTDDDL